MGHVKLLTILLFFLASGSSASQIETQINDFIENHETKRLQTTYPNARIEIEIQNRVALEYLPDCDNQYFTIENQRPESMSRTTYAIACETPFWKSYVPVRQNIFITGIKAAAPISRGDVISRQNTDIGEVDLATLRGHLYTEQNPPYGLLASRNIRINDFITDGQTEQPNLVKKGARVLITAQSNSIVVRMNGVALEDGVKGQQIRVENVSSGRIVYGKVVSSGEVLVNY
ncbi:flagellar basal body P-ring formation chaperone FlgA [Marinomonas ostreistagni]|uniref:flagellar basal body P-ring formation chaperone FlgA n=1 Tax=Marinomonas ostreistagni TaxID=359209 RepID=UPI001951ACD1|nr:flagellar basal body P-ring formation chaperone FlgA [Marinomonas ostreistagni]MBM6551127.1 flagellar basal body P-ring formation protein FlgA [Marinomonas ostreistagni]